MTELSEELDMKIKLFTEEVKAGKHPDWIIQPDGQLKHVGEKTLEESGAEYFRNYPHGPSEEEEK
jgi:hypothetical protein